MKYRYIYGPVNSRRLGKSLGVSPIPFKTCNMSCIYCQLGRTKKFSTEIKDYVPVEDLLKELEDYTTHNLQKDSPDWITIVGDGEPLLYKSIGKIINFIKENTTKPLALITNGTLLNRKDIQEELKKIDMIMPSIDAGCEENFIKINRPHPSIKFSEFIENLIEFRKNYRGILSVEIMIIKGINDSKKHIEQIIEILKKLSPDEVFINIPYRPPAENFVEPPDEEVLKEIKEEIKKHFRIKSVFNPKTKFYLETIKTIDDIVDIVKRHPIKIREIEDIIKQQNISLEEIKNEKRLKIIKFNQEDFILFNN